MLFIAVIIVAIVFCSLVVLCLKCSSRCNCVFARFVLKTEIPVLFCSHIWVKESINLLI